MVSIADLIIWMELKKDGLTELSDVNQNELINFSWQNVKAD